MSTPIIDHMQDFLEAKRAEGLLTSTIKWYKFHIQRFLKELNGREPTLKLCRSYLAGLADAGLSPSMQRGAAITIKAFSRWLSEEGVGVDFAAKLRLPKNRKHLPRDVKLSDMAAAFEVASTRDRALLMFLLDTGARRAETTSLHWIDVDLEERRIKLTGKGDKQRMVAITDKTAELLKSIRPAKVSSGDHVFVGQNGPLTPNGLSMVLRRLKEKAGIVGALNPHAFRHAFGSNFVRNGGDLESLRRILGHEDIATTQIYLQLGQQELEDKQRKLQPVNSLKLPS